MKYFSLRSLFYPVLLLALIACSASKQGTGINSAIPAEPGDSLVAYLERTRCFGVCPYYSIHIYKSGYVLYVGIDHVEKIGRYFTFLPEQKVKSIGEKAISIGYFELNNEYRNPYLTDFPTVYSEVRYNGMQKKITHYDADPPKSLIEMENFIDELFTTATVWQMHPDQNFKD